MVKTTVDADGLVTEITNLMVSRAENVLALETLGHKCVLATLASIKGVVAINLVLLDQGRLAHINRVRPKIRIIISHMFRGGRLFFFDFNLDGRRSGGRQSAAR